MFESISNGLKTAINKVLPGTYTKPELYTEIGFLVSDSNIKPQSTYSEGDPRRYVAAMLKSLDKGSETIAAFAHDLPRHTTVIDRVRGESSEISRAERETEVNKILEELSELCASEIPNIKPIVSHLSQGLMAEVLNVINQQFSFVKNGSPVYFQLPQVSNKSKLTFDTVSNSVGLEYNVNGFAASVADMFNDASDEELQRLSTFDESKSEIRIKCITSIKFDNLYTLRELPAPKEIADCIVIQDIYIECLNKDIKLSCKPIMNEFIFSKKPATTNDEWVDIDEQLNSRNIDTTQPTTNAQNTEAAKPSWWDNIASLASWFKQKISTTFTSALDWMRSKFTPNKQLNYAALECSDVILKNSIIQSFQLREQNIKKMLNSADAKDNILSIRQELDSLEEDWRKFLEAKNNIAQVSQAYVETRKQLMITSPLERQALDVMSNACSKPTLKRRNTI